MPESNPSASAVEASLEQVLAWPGLARSPQLAKFLTYIVKARLRGDEVSIKAYSIAVDVFGRSPSFDPQTDPIVRVQARRLRALLEEYYQGEGAASAVRFYLPVGRYIPEFVLQQTPVAPDAAAPEAAVAVPVRPARLLSRSRLGDATVLVSLAIIVVAIVVLIGMVFQPRPTRMAVPQPPMLAIGEFTAVADGDVAVADVAGLAIELVTDLQLFSNVVPSYQPSGTEPPPDSAERPSFVLSGIARREVARVQVTANLKRVGSDAVVWSDTVEMSVAGPDGQVDDVSQRFAEQLGSQRGPLHSTAMAWLAANGSIDGNETEYLCGLLFSRYRDSDMAEDAERAKRCLTALVQREPESVEAQAALGSLLADTVAVELPPGQVDPQPIAEAERLILAALRRASTNSMIWEQYGRLLETQDRSDEADLAFASALQLNPANLDAQAAYARMLSLRGSSLRGTVLANDAIEHAVVAPPWYYAAPAINALRIGDYATMLVDAEKLAKGDPELASVLATVAAHRTGSEAVLNRFFAQLLDVTRFRSFGILPVLRQRIPDRAMVERLADELRDAGVAAEALNGP